MLTLRRLLLVEPLVSCSRPPRSLPPLVTWLSSHSRATTTRLPNLPSPLPVTPWLVVWILASCLTPTTPSTRPLKLLCKSWLPLLSVSISVVLQHYTCSNRPQRVLLQAGQPLRFRHDLLHQPHRRQDPGPVPVHGHCPEGQGNRQCHHR